MSNENTGSNPFNRWWWVALGGIILVAIALALILTGVIGPTNADPAPPPTAAGTVPPTSGGTVPPPPAGGVCDVPAGDQSIPTVGPQATWQTNVYFLYPTSASYGPTSNPSSEAWGCFQHSPTGALFAAANVLNATFSDERTTVVPEAVLASSALDIWLSSQTPGGQVAGKVAQITGFQFVTVQPDVVVLRLGLQQQDTKVFFTFAVVWDSSTSNWRGDFSQSTLTPRVDTLAGYTPWGASS